jgi:hypothetical protein
MRAPAGTCISRNPRPCPRSYLAGTGPRVVCVAAGGALSGALECVDAEAFCGNWRGALWVVDDMYHYKTGPGLPKTVRAVCLPVRHLSCGTGAAHNG